MGSEVKSILMIISLSTKSLVLLRSKQWGHWDWIFW